MNNLYEGWWGSQNYYHALQGKLKFSGNTFSEELTPLALKGQYHAIFSNTLKIEKTLYSVDSS